jgi:hypothetical protein
MNDILFLKVILLRRLINSKSFLMCSNLPLSFNFHLSLLLPLHSVWIIILRVQLNLSWDTRVNVMSISDSKVRGRTLHLSLSGLSSWSIIAIELILMQLFRFQASSNILSGCLLHQLEFLLILQLLRKFLPILMRKCIDVFLL